MTAANKRPAAAGLRTQRKQKELSALRKSPLRKIRLRSAESMPILTEQQSRFTKMFPIHWKKDITPLPKEPFLPRKNRKIKLIYTDFRAQTNL